MTGRALGEEAQAEKAAQKPSWCSDKIHLSMLLTLFVAERNYSTNCFFSSFIISLIRNISLHCLKYKLFKKGLGTRGIFNILAGYRRGFRRLSRGRNLNTHNIFCTRNIISGEVSGYGFSGTDLI